MRFRFRLADSHRRGLRTAIDLLLSGGLTGVVLFLLDVAGVKVTLEQFTAALVTLTPILSVIKNSLEDKTGRSFLVSKARPEPDPTQGEAPPVQPTREEVTPEPEETEVVLSNGQVLYREVPPGYVLLAVDPDDLEDSDEVVGYVR